MDENAVVNQKLWDELAPLHAASAYYNVDAFLRGGSSLGQPELGEVGDVAGKHLLHLMCHIGLDTISWARLGARVTGVDFSSQALRIAREVASQVGVDAEFVHCDVMAAADQLDSTYDIVYLSRGVLCWIRDLAAWADVCARLLKPGGVFYLLERHPIAEALEGGSYFYTPEPQVVVSDGSYAVSDAGMANQESREWRHPVGDVVTALAGAGIRIEFLHEFPAADGKLPELFSVRGIR